MYSISGTYFQIFFPGRLRYLTLTDPGKVWMPDTFFRNEKTGHFHAILVNNVYVRIFPNGDVLFSIRFTLNEIYRLGIIRHISYSMTLAVYIFRSIVVVFFSGILLLVTLN